MPSCKRFGNIGLMVDQQMDPGVGIAGTDQQVGVVGPDDNPAAFYGGSIRQQLKEPLPVDDDLQGIVIVHGGGGAAPHKK